MMLSKLRTQNAIHSMRVLAQKLRSSWVVRDIQGECIVVSANGIHQVRRTFKTCMQVEKAIAPSTSVSETVVKKIQQGSPTMGETYLTGTNAGVLDEMYTAWKQDKSAVSSSWNTFFTNIEMGNIPAWTYSPQTVPRKKHAGQRMGVEPLPSSMSSLQLLPVMDKTLKVLQIIRSYRVFGHLAADLDPLGLWKREFYSELDYLSYGFTEADLDTCFYVGHEFAPTDGMISLRAILEKLNRVYCGAIGIEYMHIQNPQMKNWLCTKIEKEGLGKDTFDFHKKKQVLSWLVRANDFEQFLASMYKTAKRFGLEGCESLIPGLEALLLRSSDLGVETVVMGMAHRGRLNVLSNVLSKPLVQIFGEFADKQYETAVASQFLGSGDVKYHLGTSTDRTLVNGRKMHLSLAANPSHLEAVDPVVVGKVRAKQHFLKDENRSRVMGILLHGDAAFSGQGVVAETLELSDLPEYTTGGTIHIIINNQIGFTTSPKFARSSPYPTDLAKGLQAPIFHVNGDDPEAVVRVSELAAEWRQTFKRDVVIDIFCYRRHGHNEMDQPMFTQPNMYTKIRNHPTTLDVYMKRLMEEGTLKEDELEKVRSEYREFCMKEFDRSKSLSLSVPDWLEANWSSMLRPDTLATKKRTGLPVDVLRKIGRQLTILPSDINLHKTIRKLYEARWQAIESGQGIDWSTAEALAFATLLEEGYTVRLSGQDCERGTFSQRHAILFGQEDECTYIPLNHLSTKQVRFQVCNSSLSEMAVLGFEHGFSLESPHALVLWEAQFGDFCNGAQVIIDQFISCGEQKWRRQSGLTMLLPHGFEGQGPEHSSARLERFLQLVSEDAESTIWLNQNESQARMIQMQEVNLQVAYPSTPANFFHFLRRQIHREFRKPLVVMTPKSLLKASYCTSEISEMAEQTVVSDIFPDPSPHLVPDAQIVRVVFCSGKVYYDLVHARENNQIKDVAIVRIEQLSPFPFINVHRQLRRYPHAQSIFWCQEEPQNMGAWTFVSSRIEHAMKNVKRDSPYPPLQYAGRPPAASPAAGSYRVHLREMNSLLKCALDGDRVGNAWKEST